MNIHTLIRAARLALCSSAFLFGVQQAAAHGVQIGYGVLTNGYIRVYVEHWHGDFPPLNSSPLNITITSGSGTTTATYGAHGSVKNTAWNNLPGLGASINILAKCGQANTYNDWLYWDFAPGACNQPVTITINSGTTVVTTESCANLYPQTIAGQIFTDQGAPVITASNLTVPGSCSGANVNFNVSVVDDCDPNPVVTYSHASGSFFPIGTTVVTVTATDNTGKTSVKTFNVTVFVNDSTPPVLTVPGPITAGNAAGSCGANVTFATSATDNCSAVTIVNTPASGAFFPVGTTTVTSVATDASGNKTTKTFSVTVTDNEAPKITCPGDLTVVAAAGACNATVNFAATATDNCAGVTVSYSPASGSTFPRGTTAVTATATDASGKSVSCTFNVTVKETTPPNITTPAMAKTVECDGAGNLAALGAWLASNGGAAATDSCGPVTWTNSFTGLSDGCGATGTATVVFTATDVDGNSATTTAAFTIVDTTPPAIAVPASNSVVECDGAGNIAALSAWLASNGGGTATDACGRVTWSNNFTGLSDGCGATGTASVTFVATDECGNASSSTATFTIVDTTAPTLASNVRDILPNEAPITFTVTAQDVCGSATATVTSVTSHAINGSGQLIDKSGSTVIQIAGSQVTIVNSGGVGTIFTIHATAVDACGNTTPAQFVVKVLRPANEGVGNGVDGNTPGHANNGGNDDPGTAPGNPGAKSKGGG